MNWNAILESYLKTQLQLAEGTRRRLRYSVNRWGKIHSGEMDEDSFGRFRQGCLQKGLSPHSAEQTVRDIGYLLRHAGIVVDTGRPLRRPPPDPQVPALSEVGKCFANASVTRWPLRSDKDDWWRCFWSLGLWTALRIRDILDLRWDAIHGNILRHSPKKTLRFGLRQEIPLHEAVLRCLRAMSQDGEYIFSPRFAMKQLRREIDRQCKAAQAGHITPHDLRRAGITMWTIAHPEAGRLIHGCGKKDVMRHYLSPLRILENAAPRCSLPAEMLTEEERKRAEQDEHQLITRFRQADPSQKELMLAICQKLVN
jgi:integrase